MFSAVAETKIIVPQVHEWMQMEIPSKVNGDREGKHRTQSFDCMRMSNSHGSGTWSCKNPTH